MAETNKKEKIDQQDIALLIHDWMQNKANVAAWKKLTHAVVECAPKLHTLTQGTKKNMTALTHICLDALIFDDKATYRHARAVLLAYMKTYELATKMSVHVNTVERGYRIVAMHSDRMWGHVPLVLIPMSRLAFSLQALSFKGTIEERAAYRSKVQWNNVQSRDLAV
ncbi:MAG: hypothetical protein WC612_05940 [Bdellovibrionales bacterium]